MIRKLVRSVALTHTRTHRQHFRNTYIDGHNELKNYYSVETCEQIDSFLFCFKIPNKRKIITRFISRQTFDKLFFLALYLNIQSILYDHWFQSSFFLPWYIYIYRRDQKSKFIVIFINYIEIHWKEEPAHRKWIQLSYYYYEYAGPFWTHSIQHFMWNVRKRVWSNFYFPFFIWLVASICILSKRIYIFLSQTSSSSMACTCTCINCVCWCWQSKPGDCRQTNGIILLEHHIITVVCNNNNMKSEWPACCSP